MRAMPSIRNRRASENLLFFCLNLRRNNEKVPFLVMWRKSYDADWHNVTILVMLRESNRHDPCFLLFPRHSVVSTPQCCFLATVVSPKMLELVQIGVGVPINSIE